MKNSRILIIDGRRLRVPPRIQRCGAGWQVRYLGTRYFSDGSHGPRASLRAAARELSQRYAVQAPAPTVRVRRAPLPHKTSDLPAGISGPVLIRKRGRTDYAEFKVSLPRRGRPSGGASVYIANKRTWTGERYLAALQKAIGLRASAVRAFLA